MDEDLKQNVDTSSFAFKNGIEAGLNSVEDTKNWQAGNELGQELKDDVKDKGADCYSAFQRRFSTTFFERWCGWQ